MHLYVHLHLCLNYVWSRVLLMIAVHVSTDMEYVPQVMVHSIYKIRKSIKREKSLQVISIPISSVGIY